ncbi:MAG: pantetheine-phosphate adenylyltransferase [Tissierellia bacterium]|nr:pantetheine-phosphate adenylyltransferase [Tissierellia bacterium]
MKVIYAGSFDPITNGHLDIIYRAREIFGEVVVAVLNNRNKKGLFTVAERMELIEKVLEDQNHIEVDSFEGLLVDYARERKIGTIVRGLRSASDYENEYMLAMANKNYRDGVETVFLLSAHDQLFVSSSLAKEVATFGGETDMFVPELVGQALKEKMEGK